MRLTDKFSECRDDHCPAIRDTSDPALVAIQGEILADPEALADLGAIPGHENVVVIPRSLLAAYHASGR